MKCSIVCNTYNHEATIARTIEHFLIQETNFEFEILIHDDASSDGTQRIIKQYEERYPKLIKAIYQDQNQTCLGRSVSLINQARAMGTYIAFCEGDDYWLDPKKLQIQADVLDADPSILLVGHASRVQNHQVPFFHKLWRVDPTKLDMDTLIRLRGIVFANNTMMIRRNAFDYPEFVKDFKVADVKRVLFAALYGKIAYIDRCMSVYQVGLKGSWTDRVRLNPRRVVEHYQSEIQFYQSFDDFTQGAYHDAIQFVLDKLTYLICLQDRNPQCFSLAHYRQLSLFHRCRDHLHYMFPSQFRLLAYLRYRYFI